MNNSSDDLHPQEYSHLRLKRPVLKYFGGGFRRARWTSSYFPQHQSYVEPCFGAGSILFNKQISKLETINDIDGRVVNFFQVLRQVPEDLIRLVWTTPWAEDEFRTSLRVAEDPLEDARRFFFSCWGSIKGGPNSGRSDFRWQKKLTRRSAAVRDVANLDYLNQAAFRLKNVQILSRDGLEILEKFVDQDCLIYFDPPYVHSLRTNRKGYRFEVSDHWHCSAAGILRRACGPAIVAGYPSPLYRKLFEEYGWRRIDRVSRVNSGGRKIDALWLSPTTQELLAQNG